nr:MAG TPA: hypothetical protein [Caudoviricetes sp.]
MLCGKSLSCSDAFSVLSKDPSSVVSSPIDLLIVNLYNNLSGQQRLFVK